MLQFFTAGESHGQSLTAILLGLPAGLRIDLRFVNAELARRQQGYGRGKRMKIEKDQAIITAGLRFGKTLGSPIAITIKNRDWPNWERYMQPLRDGDHSRDLFLPRPGHCDLSGLLKFGHPDFRNVLERASARETAERVAVGALCKLLLREFNIEILSHVVSIGKIRAKPKFKNFAELRQAAEKSPLRCADPLATQRMKKLIDETKKKGDSLGGTFEVIATGVPVGLGYNAHWEDRLDAQLTAAIVSIPAIKGAEVGTAFESAQLPGSLTHDEIFFSRKAKDVPSGLGPTGGFYRRTNRAGGIEGSISNGMPIVVRGAMKPIATLKKPLRSVDIRTKKPALASVERADVCAVPAAAVVGESMIAFVVAKNFLLKFGGDSLTELKTNFDQYVNHLRKI